jgi:hypothetical protein
MNGTKLADAAPELGTSTHLTTELFKQPACPRGQSGKHLLTSSPSAFDQS